MKIIEFLKLKYRASKYKYKLDKGEIAYINSTIKSGQTVLDIGAHKAGYLFIMLKKVGKNGKIHAFEPQINLFSYITKIKNLFDWNNVTVQHLALSNVKGKVDLLIPITNAKETSSPGASIVQGKEKTQFGRVESVNTETLDVYCKTHNLSPSFLKVDVEGNELEVFEGGIEMLKKHKPTIIVEIEERHIGKEKVFKTFEFLKSLGYKGHFFKGIERLPLKDFNIEMHQNISEMKQYCNNFTFEGQL